MFGLLAGVGALTAAGCGSSRFLDEPAAAVGLKSLRATAVGPIAAAFAMVGLVDTAILLFGSEIMARAAPAAGRVVARFPADRPAAAANVVAPRPGFSPVTAAALVTFGRVDAAAAASIVADAVSSSLSEKIGVGGDVGERGGGTVAVNRGAGQTVILKYTQDLL